MKDIKKKYQDFWGISAPVFVRPYKSPEDFFQSEATLSILERLELTLMTLPSIITITGPQGVGKSTLGLFLYQTIPQQDHEICFLTAIPDLKSKGPSFWLEKQIKKFMGYQSRLGLGLGRSLEELAQEHRNLVAIIDNADHLSKKNFDEIARLCDVSSGGLTLLLIGQETLCHMIQEHPKLRLLHPSSFSLTRFSLTTIKNYVDFFTKKSKIEPGPFTAEAFSTIEKLSEGLPGSISRISENALIEGYLEKTKSIDAHHISSQEVKLPPKSTTESKNLSKFEQLPPEPLVSETGPLTPILKSVVFPESKLEPLPMTKREPMSAEREPEPEPELKPRTLTPMTDPTEPDPKVPNKPKPKKTSPIKLDSLFYRHRDQNSG